MSKKLIWLGFFVGSTLGNMLPTMWGDDMMSLSGIVLSVVGGIVGMWIGYRTGQAY